jgi:hypothetical protein
MEEQFPISAMYAAFPAALQLDRNVIAIIVDRLDAVGAEPLLRIVTNGPD